MIDTMVVLMMMMMVVMMMIVMMKEFLSWWNDCDEDDHDDGDNDDDVDDDDYDAANDDTDNNKLLLEQYLRPHSTAGGPAGVLHGGASSDNSSCSLDLGPAGGGQGRKEASGDREDREVSSFNWSDLTIVYIVFYRWSLYL